MLEQHTFSDATSSRTYATDPQPKTQEPSTGHILLSQSVDDEWGILERIPMNGRIGREAEPKHCQHLTSNLDPSCSQSYQKRPRVTNGLPMIAGGSRYYRYKFNQSHCSQEEFKLEHKRPVEVEY